MSLKANTILEWIVVGIVFGAVAGIISTLLEPWAEKIFWGTYSERYGGHLPKGMHHDFELYVKTNSLVTLDLGETPSNSATYTVQLIRKDSYVTEPVGLDQNSNCASHSVNFECSAGYGGRRHVLSKYIADSGLYVLRLTGRTGGSYYTVGVTVSRSLPPLTDARFPEKGPEYDSR